MIGIPEDELLVASMDIKHSLRDVDADYDDKLFRSAVHWAERFRWDARETLPTPGENYFIWDNWSLWQRVKCEYESGEGLLWKMYGFGQTCLLPIESYPYYKPMPLAPEDD